MKVIVPLRPNSLDEFISLIKKIDHRADFVEIWLDGVLDLGEFFEGFKKVLDAFDPSVQTLGVCKMRAERGNFEGSEADRVEILKRFLDSGGDFVDLDVARNEVNLTASVPSEKLFLSFHDFEGVSNNLNKILDQQLSLSPFLHKFAVTTNTPEDLDLFLAFVKNFPEDKRGIFTTMGDLGHKGRDEIEALEKSWGRFWAVDEDSKTAVGQKTLDELIRL